MLAKQLTPEEEAQCFKRQLLFHAMSNEDYKKTAESIMAYVDALPPEWRALVHEYGYKLVRSMRARYGEDYKKVSLALAATRIDVEF